MLALDVWEHAFYLDFHNMKQDYVRVFLEKLVDWSFVAENLRFVSCTPAASARSCDRISCHRAHTRKCARADAFFLHMFVFLHRQRDVHMNSHERTRDQKS